MGQAEYDVGAGWVREDLYSRAASLTAFRRPATYVRILNEKGHAAPCSGKAWPQLCAGLMQKADNADAILRRQGELLD